MMGASISVTQQADAARDELQQLMEITTRLEKLEKITEKLLSKTNQLYRQEQQDQRDRIREQETKE